MPALLVLDTSTERLHLGLSLAGWNAVTSAGLVLFALAALLFELRRHRAQIAALV